MEIKIDVKCSDIQAVELAEELKEIIKEILGDEEFTINIGGKCENSEH